MLKIEVIEILFPLLTNDKISVWLMTDCLGLEMESVIATSDITRYDYSQDTGVPTKSSFV